jgi:iron complex transport system permease protein
VKIPILDILEILSGAETGNFAWEGIIWKIRFPKAITAILAGGALSLAGLQMQTLFRNPLAGPSVLGITAGASLGVAIVVLSGFSATAIFALGQLGFGESWIMLLASTAGASLVFGLVLLISFRVSNNVALLIIGLMVGNMTLALVSIWQYFSSPELIKDFLLWTFGNLGGVTNEQLLVLAIVVGIGSIGTFLISKPLNLLLLGDNYAKSMGLNIQKSRIIIIVLTSLLAGAITGFCGPIGFVGIAIPHIARQIFKTSDHKILIPNSFLLGAIILLACDIVAQLPSSYSVLPINAVTALFGSPVVIWVMVRNRRSASVESENAKEETDFSPTQHSKIQLKTENLKVGYGNKALLENLNLTLESGKLIALLGKNGSGKSTLLRAISNLETPLAGSIYLSAISNEPMVQASTLCTIEQRNWQEINVKEKAQLMSLVLTEKDFFGNLKVRDLVAMGRYSYSNWLGKLQPEDEKYVDWAISEVGMGTFAEREIATLSDGERQKALIARALAQDTPLFILDEPTAHLDLPNRIQTFKLLKKCAKERNQAVLLSTHELDLALKLADEIWLVEKNTVLKLRTSDELETRENLNKVFGIEEEEIQNDFFHVNP